MLVRLPPTAQKRSPVARAGLRVIGDAVCSGNRVYGQGMTSAARQAMVLRSRSVRVVSPVDPLSALLRPGRLFRVVWSARSRTPGAEPPGMAVAT